MNSLELTVLEPYENGELKPHTVGILREIEEQNQQYEIEDKFERKELRKGLEIRLIKKFDKTKINARRECWYLLDTTWLNEWAHWVEGKSDDPPGKLSSSGLRDDDGNILKGLKAKLDYRGVPPTVYFIFRELYGKDDTQPICRYTVDIYNVPVPDEDLVKINAEPQMKARVVVNKIREKYVKWGNDDDDDDEDDWCCCGLSRDHVESILYWVLTFGARSRSGRKNIRYRDYKPLKKTTNDEDIMSEWSVRSNSTLASIQTDRSSNTSIGDADRNYGQNSIVRNWVMGMMGYTGH